MLTSKQRAKLKSVGAELSAAYQMGKNEIDENYIIQVNAGLDAREIIKISVLENSGHTAREAAEILAEKTDAEIVQVIGAKVVLYRKSRKPEKRELSKLIEGVKIIKKFKN